MADATYRMGRQATRWPVVLAALVALSSLFVVVGAGVAEAAPPCGQPNSTCHLAFRFEDPAGSGSYTNTEPHYAGKGLTITNTELVPTIGAGVLPVVLEVEDELGHRDTKYAEQISVAVFSSTVSGWMLSGTKTVTAVNGAAAFTDLSLDVPGYYQLIGTATGAGIASAVSPAFKIADDVCGQGETCTSSFHQDGTLLMDASLSYGGDGTVALSVGIDGGSNCSTADFTDPFFHAPAEWTVDEVLATGADTKLLTVRIAKAWRQIVLDRGTRSYRPCITATVEFTTWENSPLTFNAATGEFTGLGPDCSKTIEFFCRAFVKSNKAGDILEGISLPSGASVPGDPHGR